jgi:WhiB family transcriptional regulator, redox-sensing transcriptional regulator
MKFPDMERANCVGVDTDLFFPDSSVQEQSIVKAMTKMCHQCPIYFECLEYALAVKVDGIWAGTTPAERKRLRKKRGITGIPIASQYLDEYLLSQSQEAKNARASRARRTQATKERLAAECLTQQ